MSNQLSALVDAAYASIYALAEDVANTPQPKFLKALPDQGRFKLSSVWVELEDGTYQHLQSARITTAQRLAGYTRVINRG